MYGFYGSEGVLGGLIISMNALPVWALSLYIMAVAFISTCLSYEILVRIWDEREGKGMGRAISFFFHHRYSFFLYFTYRL